MGVTLSPAALTPWQAWLSPEPCAPGRPRLCSRPHGRQPAVLTRTYQTQGRLQSQARLSSPRLSRQDGSSVATSSPALGSWPGSTEDVTCWAPAKCWSRVEYTYEGKTSSGSMARRLPGLGSVPGARQQPLTPENLRLGREMETWGSKGQRTGVCLHSEAVSVPGVGSGRASCRRRHRSSRASEAGGWASQVGVQLEHRNGIGTKTARGSGARTPTEPWAF